MVNHSSPTMAVCSWRRGVAWWKEAFKLIRAYPQIWFALGSGYLCCTLLPLLLLGSLVSENAALLWTVLLPCFQIGVVSAAWSQVRKEKPTFNHLFNGFKADVKTLIGIGCVLTISTLAVNYLSGSLGGEEHFAEEMMKNRDNPEALMALYSQPGFWIQPLISWTLNSLVFIAGWLSPMLVVFLHSKVASAILNSFKAVFQNWRAMLVYGAVIPLVMLMISLFALLVIAPLALVLGPVLGMSGEVAAQWCFIALMIVMLPLIGMVWQISAFVAYCDIFHPNDRVFP